MSAPAASAFSPRSARPPITRRWRRALDYLRREQEADGSWFGRWGTNYIYGTWSVLSALNAAGVDPKHRAMRRAVDWLVAHQRAGWRLGRRPARAIGPTRRVARRRTAPHRRRPGRLLGADGGRRSRQSGGGARHRLSDRDARTRDGNWDEPWYTAVGFPRVFYLRYHGYRAFFPLWALARYRRLSLANSRRVPFGL